MLSLHKHIRHACRHICWCRIYRGYAQTQTLCGSIWRCQWVHPSCLSGPPLAGYVMVSHQYCPGGIIQHLSILINTSASLPKLNWLAARMTRHKLETGRTAHPKEGLLAKKNYSSPHYIRRTVPPCRLGCRSDKPANTPVISRYADVKQRQTGREEVRLSCWQLVITALSQQHLADEHGTLLMARAEMSGSIKRLQCPHSGLGTKIIHLASDPSRHETFNSIAIHHVASVYT